MKNKLSYEQDEI